MSASVERKPKAIRVSSLSFGLVDRSAPLADPAGLREPLGNSYGDHQRGR
jgi:hypothetical protein